MNLTFLVVEVTDRMEPQGYSRAATYRVMCGDEPLDDGQWRWAAPTRDELPAYAAGDQFELTTRGDTLRGEPVYLEAGQLWWLSSRLELVMLTEFPRAGLAACVVSAVEGAPHDLGDHLVISGTQMGGIPPEYGPIFIAQGDRKVAS